jgi:hypothetical protein
MKETEYTVSLKKGCSSPVVQCCGQQWGINWYHRIYGAIGCVSHKPLGCTVIHPFGVTTAQFANAMQ